MEMKKYRDIERLKSQNFNMFEVGEEVETVKLISEDFGKLCGTTSMKLAKKILNNRLGKV